MLSFDTLRIDAQAEAERIETAIREQVFTRLKRRGAVIGVSGGIDSSVVAALCARSLGKDRVIALLLPETESSDDSLRLGRLVAEQLGIQAIEENISPLLEAAHCYQRRDAAIRTLIPEYGPGYKCKLVLPSLLGGSSYNLFSVIAQSPSGERQQARLTPEAYYGIVAASNFKQRTRKMLEYYYADRHNYAVAGTPNRLEYELGFFVKNGDGAADLKPIGHLYKTQVYQLAAHLGIPDEIQQRPPTTDTYPLEQTQEEFYFSIPYHMLDLCLYADTQGIAPTEAASALGLTEQQVERVYRDIQSKRSNATYLPLSPLLVEEGSTLAR